MIILAEFQGERARSRQIQGLIMYYRATHHEAKRSKLPHRRRCQKQG